MAKNFHEHYDRPELPLPPDRSTGLVFTAIALIAGIMLRPVIIDDDHGAAALLSTVEVGFLQDMSAHHQQALSMAQLIDRPGVDDGVRSLARQIRVAQANEIGTMLSLIHISEPTRPY